MHIALILLKNLFDVDLYFFMNIVLKTSEFGNPISKENGTITMCTFWKFLAFRRVLEITRVYNFVFSFKTNDAMGDEDLKVKIANYRK